MVFKVSGKTWIKYLTLCLLSFAVFFPILWMVSTSLKYPSELFTSGLIPKQPTLENFRIVTKKWPLFVWLMNTAIITAGVMFGRILTSILASYGFARFNFPGKKLLFMGVIGTMIIPFAITMIPNYILISSIGLLNNHWGVILVYIPSGFGIFFLRQHIMALPQELFDAAAIDGANSWQVLWKIVVPLIKGAIFALTVLLCIEAWNMYLWPLLVLTEPKRQTLSIGLQYFQDREYGIMWGELMAAACLAQAPVLLIYIVARKHIIHASITSGFK